MAMQFGRADRSHEPNWIQNGLMAGATIELSARSAAPPSGESDAHRGDRVDRQFTRTAPDQLWVTDNHRAPDSGEQGVLLRAP